MPCEFPNNSIPPVVEEDNQEELIAQAIQVIIEQKIQEEKEREQKEREAILSVQYPWEIDVHHSIIPSLYLPVGITRMRTFPILMNGNRAVPIRMPGDEKNLERAEYLTTAFLIRSIELQLQAHPEEFKGETIIGRLNQDLYACSSYFRDTFRANLGNPSIEYIQLIAPFYEWFPYSFARPEQNIRVAYFPGDNETTEFVFPPRGSPLFQSIAEWSVVNNVSEINFIGYYELVYSIQ